MLLRGLRSVFMDCRTQSSWLLNLSTNMLHQSCIITNENVLSDWPVSDLPFSLFKRSALSMNAGLCMFSAVYVHSCFIRTETVLMWRSTLEMLLPVSNAVSPRENEWCGWSNSVSYARFSNSTAALRKLLNRSMKLYLKAWAVLYSDVCLCVCLCGEMRILHWWADGRQQFSGDQGSGTLISHTHTHIHHHSPWPI